MRNIDQDAFHKLKLSLDLYTPYVIEPGIIERHVEPLSFHTDRESNQDGSEGLRENIQIY